MPEPTIELQLRLPLEVSSYVAAVADKSGADPGTVIGVLLALHVLRNPMPERGKPAAKAPAKKGVRK